MPTSNPPEASTAPTTPNISSIGLSRILDSAKEFVSFLAPANLAPCPPFPVATSSYPELATPDVKRPSSKFRKLQLPEKELEVVLRTYRQRLEQLRRGARHEYGMICEAQSLSTQLHIEKVFSIYWIQTRDALLERTVEIATHAAAIAPPGKPRVFNKEFVPIFEYVFGQAEGGHIKSRDKRFLSALTDMEYRQITIWFQNHRARTKKKFQNGQYVPPPPSLAETTAKLRAFLAKEDAKSSDQKVVILTTERPGFVDLDFEEEEMDVEHDSLDVQNEHLSMLVEGDEPSSLDDWVPSPGSFPNLYLPVNREVPSFPPPQWPRAPQLWLPRKVPVGDADVFAITRKLQKVFITPPTRVETTVTLTQPMKAVTAARCTLANKVLNSIRQFVPMPGCPEERVVSNKKPKKNRKSKNMVAPHYVINVTSAQGEHDATQTNAQNSTVDQITGASTKNRQVQVSGDEDPPMLQDTEVPQASRDAPLNPQVGQAPHIVQASARARQQLPLVQYYPVQRPQNVQVSIAQTTRQPPGTQNPPISYPQNLHLPTIGTHSSQHLPVVQNPPVPQPQNLQVSKAQQQQAAQNPPISHPQNMFLPPIGGHSGQHLPNLQNPPVTQSPQTSNDASPNDPALPVLCTHVSRMEIDTEKSKPGACRYNLRTYKNLFVYPTLEEMAAAHQMVTDDLGRAVQPYSMDHPLPPLDVPVDDWMDHATAMQVLRMTLKDINYQGPMPSDDPIVYTFGPNFRVDPVSEHLKRTLEPHYSHAFEEEETRAALETAFTGNREDFQFEPVERPQSPPPPVPTADPFPESFYLNEPSQDFNDIQYADQFYDSEGVPLPFPAMTDPSLQIPSNADVNAMLAFDPLYDPTGTAIPFTLYEALRASSSQNRPDDYDLMEPPFQDPYMFLIMDPSSPAIVAPSSEPEPQPEQQPELEPGPPITIYPSYFPQVPRITEEFKKAATYLSEWFDTVTGVKNKKPEFVDPDEMLKYLA